MSDNKKLKKNAKKSKNNKKLSGIEKFIFDALEAGEYVYRYVDGNEQKRVLYVLDFADINTQRAIIGRMHCFYKPSELNRKVICLNDFQMFLYDQEFTASTELLEQILKERNILQE